jgi:hypothetical protein
MIQNGSLYNGMLQNGMLQNGMLQNGMLQNGTLPNSTLLMEPWMCSVTMNIAPPSHGLVWALSLT